MPRWAPGDSPQVETDAVGSTGRCGLGGKGSTADSWHEWSWMVWYDIKHQRSYLYKILETISDLSYIYIYYLWMISWFDISWLLESVSLSWYQYTYIYIYIKHPNGRQIEFRIYTDRRWDSARPTGASATHAEACGMLEFTWVDIMPHIHEYHKQRGIRMYPIISHPNDHGNHCETTLRFPEPRVKLVIRTAQKERLHLKRPNGRHQWVTGRDDQYVPSGYD